MSAWLQIIRGLIFDNLGLKFVALLLALVVYLHVYTERQATMVVAFPVQLTDLADTLSLSGPPMPLIQAELRGTGKQLIRLRLTEPRLKISLAGVGPGRFQRSVTAEDLPILAHEGLSILRLIGPLIVETTLARRLEKTLRVIPLVEGIPQAGWAYVGGAIADPPMVTVRGPITTVAALDSVLLIPVRIGGKATLVKADTDIDTLPPWCSASPRRFTVTVPLAHTSP